MYTCKLYLLTECVDQLANSSDTQAVAPLQYVLK